MGRSRFLYVLAGMWWVFLSVGVLVPLLPQYITDTLAASNSAVGTTILVYAVASIAARPVAASYLRRHEPWTLMALLALVGALALVLTPLVHDLRWMYALRFVDGLMVGGFYTAAATAVVRESPSHKRGSALSYFSVPLFLGVAVGPMLGDWFIDVLGHETSWIAGGVVMLLAAPICLLGGVSTRRAQARDSIVASANQLGASVPAMRLADLWRTVAHPSALLPAAVLALVVAGWAGFQAYVPLYGREIGLTATGSVFFAYSIVVVSIRVVGASLFDRLSMVKMVLAGSVANLAGLLVAWLWRDPVALYAAAVLMALAIALMYPMLLRIALHGVPAHEEPAVVGTYSLAYDVGAGLGAAALGLLVSAQSYSAVFLGGACCGALAIVLVLVRLWPIRSRYPSQPRRPMAAPDGRTKVSLRDEKREPR